MNNIKKDFLRLGRKKDSKPLLVGKLESLYSAVNNPNSSLNGRDAMRFIDDTTYNIISTLGYSFNKYSALFNLEAHDKAYYISRLEQVRMRVVENIQETFKNFEKTNGGTKIFMQTAGGQRFLTVGQQFLIDIEKTMKYSVKNVTENWQEILK